ncbi:alpha/beta hydrolase [Lactiplantibacillus dongliensis]|uniref:Alpha/beta hydrolase n=1 Tax=Lactiplantibacillus dongliensis TaxID=2559919 RepID=A0ABW1R5M7_9LACO|nr:alpha/beta hydrolase [Lactiplantibacillus dongliensis]
MGRKLGFWLGLLVVVVLIGGGAYWGIQNHDTKGSRRAVPTFYLHGYGASGRSSQSMIAAAQRQKRATKVYTATVSKTGQVTLRGHWPAKVKRPIVQVVFKANQNSNYQTTSHWFKQVLLAVKQRHTFTRYNAVAHSMGNLTLWTAILRYDGQRGLPRVNRVVDIAGHFDGIIGMDDEPNQIKLAKNGRPKPINASYRPLLTLRQKLAKHQVSILNVYGNLDNGSHSDGRVSNASSQSLRYLVAGRARNYREREFHGRSAQHSQLYENPKVDRVINRFLWQ